MNSFLTKRLMFLPAALLLAAPGIARAGITVDGDLTDLVAQAQADQSDRELDVTDAFVSGWDFNHVYVYYNPKADTLYVGLQLVPNGALPGVPGDADGDGNPNDTSRLDVPVDQFGVGLDETYTIAIDADLDGKFDGLGDTLFLYRNNEIQVVRGDGTATHLVMAGEIALGMRGATGFTGLPNENRTTDDIEIAIKDFSLAFASDSASGSPCSFGLDVFAGSLVDTLPEDRLDTTLLFAFPLGVVFENQFVIPAGAGDDVCVRASVGDVLTIRATVTNTTDVTLTPVWINHHIPAGLEYVVGSVDGAVQGKIQPLRGGFLVRHLRPGNDLTMSPGEVEVVTFQVRVTSEPTTPFVIRGYAEGVLDTDRSDCRYSCLDALCVMSAIQ